MIFIYLYIIYDAYIFIIIYSVYYSYYSYYSYCSIKRHPHPYAHQPGPTFLLHSGTLESPRLYQQQHLQQQQHQQQQDDAVGSQSNKNQTNQIL